MLSPAQEERIQKEIIAIYRDTETVLGRYRKMQSIARILLTISVALATWLAMADVGGRWLFGIVFFSAGAAIAATFWLNLSMLQLPRFVQYTCLREDIGKLPNKSPEPTPTAVTPPATGKQSE